MTQYFEEYGPRLAELGYTVLPIKPGTKRPDLKNWNTDPPNLERVRRGAVNGWAHHFTGVHARHTPAIDVDVLDPEIADQMSRAIDDIFPGVALMTRTGLAPKFLIPFRSDEPFKKLTSKTYTDGKREHKVEILGDGQQWVAYAVHPDTGRPYAWFDGLGDEGISGTALAALPELTRKDATRVVGAFEVLAASRVAAGSWRAVSSPAIERDRPVAGDPFAADTPPTDLTRAQVEWVISKIDSSQYGRWIDVGMALHHQYGGADEGFEIWDSWSATAGNYKAEVLPTHWESFGHRTDAPTTMRGLLKEVGQPPKPPRELDGEFVQAARFATEQRVEWCIKHVLPSRALTIIYGEPGSGKSFLALDMVAHVARGLPWRKHRTRQASVAYVAAEGVAGFGNRLRAYGAGHGVDLASVPLYVRGGALTLTEQQLALAEALAAIPDLGVVVIDTLAAVTPGANENTSEDMGAAIAAANLVIASTGAAVILIHHANKQNTMRGWSGLLGAADSTISVERNESKRTAHVEKMKEGEDSGKYPFKLRIVELGADEDGDTVTSCMVDESEEVAEKSAKKERKPRSGDFETSANYDKARKHLQIIEDLIGLDEANVDETDVISAIQKDETLNPMGYEDTPPTRTIKRTLHTLGEKGKIVKEGRWIRLPKK